MSTAGRTAEQRETPADNAAATRAATVAAAPLAGVSNRALARALAPGGRALQRAPVRPTGPARGTGPAAEIAALNAKLRQPASAAAARRMIDQWFDAAAKAVGAATVAGTGASHADEISASDLREFEAERAQQKEWLDNFTRSRSAAGVRDWWHSFQGFVEAKRRELALEFGHNIDIDVLRPGLSALGSYELALEGMPLDATWTSPRLITIRRGGNRGDIGAETTSGTAEIEMFDAA